MKALAFSDLHVDLDAAAKLVERSGDFDVVIGAGDFASVHEGLDDTIGALAAIETPTFLVPGNNETEDALRESAKRWEAATVLHGGSAELDGVTFFGLGAGIPTTPWDWSFDLDDAAAAESLADCPDGAVLILHSPPRGHCDRDSAGNELGSPALAAAIEDSQPIVAVCGHIHDSWGCESAIGSTPVHNLGPAGVELELSPGIEFRAMADAEQKETRDRDEWRVEVALDLDGNDDGHSAFGERLHALDLDDEARKRLGHSVIVTRDGPHIFLYAWHEEGAREAERVVRELMEADGLAGEVELTRWHPDEEAWRPADEPLPQTDAERQAEADRMEHDRIAEGEHPWEIVVDMPNVGTTRQLDAKLTEQGLPVKRRFKYLLVGAPTEEKAIEIGESLQGEVPDGAHVGIRATPEGLTSPSFVLLQNLKPGVVRDLGL